MASLSFFHIVSVHRKASEFAVMNVRKHHPDNFYYLCVDATEDFSYLAEEFDATYRYYTTRLGAPTWPYGLRRDGILEFLSRFRDACKVCNSTHMMMMEDDVLLVKPVTVEDSWGCAGADVKIGNIVPEQVHDLIEKYSGKRPTFKQYGASGGSIFKVLPFLENYDKIVDFFSKHSDEIQTYYQRLGYADCFMQIAMWVCGEDYVANPYYIDTHNHAPNFDYESFLANLPEEKQIVNNYKKYYFHD